MKVIFLDIDGVLNSSRSQVAFGRVPWPRSESYDKDSGCPPKDWDAFDMVAVKLMKRAVEESGAVVVLSSSWRLFATEEHLKELGAFLGFEIYDVTGTLPADDKRRLWRGDEIRDWLDAQSPTVSQYAIVDDDHDMLLTQRENFVHVDGREGFSYRDYTKLLEILKKGTVQRTSQFATLEDIIAASPKIHEPT